MGSRAIHARARTNVEPRAKSCLEGAQLKESPTVVILLQGYTEEGLAGTASRGEPQGILGMCLQLQASDQP